MGATLPELEVGGLVCGGEAPGEEEDVREECCCCWVVDSKTYVLFLAVVLAGLALLFERLLWDCWGAGSLSVGCCFIIPGPEGLLGRPDWMPNASYGDELRNVPGGGFVVGTRAS